MDLCSIICGRNSANFLLSRAVKCLGPNFAFATIKNFVRNFKNIGISIMKQKP